MKLLAACAALFALAGCPHKTMTDEERRDSFMKGLTTLLATHKAPTTAMIEALDTLPNAAAAEPPVTQREPLPAPVPCKGDECVIRTAAPIHEIELSVDSSLVHWDVVKTALRGEYIEGSTPEILAQQLGIIEGFTHLAVLRVRAYEAPVVGAGSDSYTGGVATGDVIVYDLKTKKRAGAFPFEIHMSETARIDAGGDPAKRIASAFAGHVDMELHSALRDFYAGKAATAVKPPEDDAHLRERQIDQLLAGAQMPVNGVEITEGASCKVVLVTALPGLLAAHPGKAPTDDPGDDVVKPAAVELVKKVMGKDCSVTFRLP